MSWFQQLLNGNIYTAERFKYILNYSKAMKINDNNDTFV
jgi:hypothetical protein